MRSAQGLADELDGAALLLLLLHGGIQACTLSLGVGRLHACKCLQAITAAAARKLKLPLARLLLLLLLHLLGLPAQVGPPRCACRVHAQLQRGCEQRQVPHACCHVGKDVPWQRLGAGARPVY